MMDRWTDDCLASFPTTDPLMGYEIMACVACDVEIRYTHFDWSIDFRLSCNVNAWQPMRCAERQTTRLNRVDSLNTTRLTDFLASASTTVIR